MATLTFKTQVYFDKQTEAYVERAFGVRRWVWNWFVSYARAQKRDTNNLPTNYTLMAAFREAVASQHDSGFEWLVNHMVATRVIEEVAKEINPCFKICREADKENWKVWKNNLHKDKSKRKKGKHVRLRKAKPRYKKRKDRTQTFSVYNGSRGNITIDSDFSIGFVASYSFRAIAHVRESIAFLRDAKVKRLTVKREAGKYWIAIVYEIPNRVRTQPTTGKVGLDLGVKTSVTSFDGSKMETIVFNTKAARKSDRLARSVNLSNKVYGSKRYEKAVLLTEKRALRARNQRNEYLEWYTTHLCRNYQEIVVDNFSFKGALAVSDHGELYRSMKYQFMLRLEQKASEYGVTVREVDHRKGQRTTRKCAVCGSTNIVVRQDRTVHCRDCGFHIDRDFNGAINSYLL